MTPSRRRSLHEAAHKSEAPARDDPGQAPGTSGGRRSFNEAAHKLGYVAPPSASAHAQESEVTRKRFEALADSNRDVVTHAGRAALAVGALGVVYGDLGTSPLYTDQAIFTSYKATAHITPAAVYGTASLIFWALMIIVSVKYAGFIMRAHNRGDGGIMALTALLQRNKVIHATLLVTLGIFGAALFFGDGMVTPSISVLGAIQGVQVATPALAHLVVPLSVAILLGLFILQRFGSGTIGWLFGPIIFLWFVVIGVIGLNQVVNDPAVVQGLSPTWAIRFFVDHGAAAYLVLGGVVLAVTGAEALYADRGHFGAGPIRLGWFGLALPALVLNYLGQGVFILHHPALAKDANTFNPFYQMIPHWGLWPMVVLAAVATVIASQAVISGSFSVAKQAVQLGFLPRLRVLHTSTVEGQIYVPIINWLLCVGVLTLTLVFRSSNKLGNIYGVAVTGTFILNTLLFLAVARLLWRTPKWKLAAIAVLFLTAEVSFFSANVAKVEHGAWLPLAIGLVMSIVMINWRRGQVIVTRNRVAQEGPLGEFLDGLASKQPPLIRTPGVAVFLCRDKDTTPLALRADVEHTHTLPEKVVIVSVDTVSIPQVEPFDRCTVEVLGGGRFKVLHLTARYGYHDNLNIPAALAQARKQGLLERNLDLEHASYFVSRITITPTPDPGMRGWQKNLFIAMARNASSAIEHFGLPGDRTVIMGSQVAL
ncbi:MAG: KUP/HAK/KT family potassium transporter [Solirubrobacterales bacterium]|nr:KUP/HAK/KT family potassium transporter [Solirubrobacterales bacterium]